MSINKIKDLCKAHDDCLTKTKIIERANKDRTWLKVVNPRNDEFYLSTDEIECLHNLIEKKGLNIEQAILGIPKG